MARRRDPLDYALKGATPRTGSESAASMEAQRQARQAAFEKQQQREAQARADTEAANAALISAQHRVAKATEKQADIRRSGGAN